MRNALNWGFGRALPRRAGAVPVASTDAEVRRGSASAVNPAVARRTPPTSPTDAKARRGSAIARRTRLSRGERRRSRRLTPRRGGEARVLRSRLSRGERRRSRRLTPRRGGEVRVRRTRLCLEECTKLGIWSRPAAAHWTCAGCVCLRGEAGAKRVRGVIRRYADSLGKLFPGEFLRAEPVGSGRRLAHG